MFEGKSIETKAKNQNRTSRKGSIDSTNSSAKSDFKIKI
jgi:hypothetical protein